jgi:hypothetical protein
MTHQLDVYTGQSANWDNKAIGIIEYIVAKQGEPYTYVEIAKTLDIPTAEVSRYLREECFEARSYDWLLKMQKYRKRAYTHYLNNHQIRKIPVLLDNGKTEMRSVLYVNFSKHSIFLMNCRLRNLRVVYQKIGDRKLIYLFENMENERTKIYYEKAQSNDDGEYFLEEDESEDAEELVYDLSEPTVSGEL